MTHARNLSRLMRLILRIEGAQARAESAQYDNAARALTRFGDSILRMAYSYLHSMPDAEDVLQDTLLRLMRGSPVFASAEHEKAWLLHVAANLCKNRLASAWTRHTAALEEDCLRIELPEDLSDVWDAVRALPEKYRAAIHLFYHEGYSIAQIADILHKKESTVRSLLHRGRELLRAQLKEAYDFDE